MLENYFFINIYKYCKFKDIFLKTHWSVFINLQVQVKILYHFLKKTLPINANNEFYIAFILVNK